MSTPLHRMAADRMPGYKRQARIAPPRSAFGDDPWLTVKEICSDFRVSKETIYRAVRSDLLAATKVGAQYRVRTSDYKRWIAAGAPTVESAA